MTRKQKDYLTLIKANVNKLELNKLYKFTDLCRTLRLEIPNSKNSKNALLKALDSIVERVYKNKKHIIIAIREQQLTIVDNRGKSKGSRNNYVGVYGEDLFNTFIYFCYHIADKNGIFKDENVDDFCITTSKHNMMCGIGIRNRYNTYIAVNQPYNFCNQLGVERIIFNFAMTKINNNSRRAFDRVLSSAVKLGLVIHENNMSVVRYKPVVTKNDKVVEWSKSEKIRGFALKSERIDIELMKQKFANDMNFKSVGALYSTYDKELILEFHERINKYTVERFGIKESYPLIELYIKKSVIKNYLQKFENIKLEDLVLVGNEKFLDGQRRTFKRSYNNYINNKKSNTKNACVQMMKNYLEQVYTIAEHVIDINSRQLIYLNGGDLRKDMLTGELKTPEQCGERIMFEDFKLELNDSVVVSVIEKNEKS